MEKVKPREVSDLPKISGFTFDKAEITTTLRSPDPQSILFYAFKGGKSNFNFFALHLAYFSSPV